jgi:hypothetical protein
MRHRDAWPHNRRSQPAPVVVLTSMPCPSCGADITPQHEEEDVLVGHTSTRTLRVARRVAFCGGCEFVHEIRPRRQR